MDPGPTPNNSIYTLVEIPVRKGPCCLHGSDCLNGKWEQGPENKNRFINEYGHEYISLNAPKQETSNEETSISSLRRAMKGMKEKKVISLRARSASANSRKVKGCRKPSFIRPKSSQLKECYVGVKKAEKIEKIVKKPTDFRLYHRMGNSTMDDLEPALSLFIGYKTAEGKFKHYRIISYEKFNVPAFKVEHGDMDAVRHASLEHLVFFYRTQFFSHKKDGKDLVDAFPFFFLAGVTEATNSRYDRRRKQ